MLYLTTHHWLCLPLIWLLSICIVHFICILGGKRLPVYQKLFTMGIKTKPGGRQSEWRMLNWPWAQHQISSKQQCFIVIRHALALCKTASVQWISIGHLHLSMDLSACRCSTVLQMNTACSCYEHSQPVSVGEFTCFLFVLGFFLASPERILEIRRVPQRQTTYYTIIYLSHIRLHIGHSI